MSYTKNQLIQAALSEAGLSSYAFDLSADQLAQAVARLDSMMAEWNARGLRLGYPIAASPSTVNLADDSNLPDWAWEAVITNLAIRLGPAYGKALGPDTKANARHSLNTVMARAAMPSQMQLSALPKGAGTKGDVFQNPASSALSVGFDAELELS